MADYFKGIERRYGLTKDEFLTLLVQQGSKCRACERELVLFSGNRREQPHVDHQHIEGKKCTKEDVRGLLCMQCNTLLGKLEKDEYRLYALLDYLGNPQDVWPRVNTAPALTRAERRREARKRRNLMRPVVYPRRTREEIEAAYQRVQEKLLTPMPWEVKLKDRE